MVKVYADLIEKGEKTLNQVPLKIREDVREELMRRGYYNIQNTRNTQNENRP